MKKFIFILSAVAVFLSACSFGDFFVDEAAVHNGLVEKMDAVLLAEENFYNEYWALADDSDIDPFLGSFDRFEYSVDDLDKYFEETKFASFQEVFVDNYKLDYRPFIYDYLDYAGDFAEEVEIEGYSFESMESYFGKLDEFTVDYVDVHNGLIDIINSQADY